MSVSHPPEERIYESSTIHQRMFTTISERQFTILATSDPLYRRWTRHEQPLLLELVSVSESLQVEPARSSNWEEVHPTVDRVA